TFRSSVSTTRSPLFSLKARATAVTGPTSRETVLPPGPASQTSSSSFSGGGFTGGAGLTAPPPGLTTWPGAVAAGQRLPARGQGIGAVVAAEGEPPLAGGGVPQLDRPVRGGRRQCLAVGAESHRGDRAVVGRQHQLLGPGQPVEAVPLPAPLRPRARLQQFVG